MIAFTIIAVLLTALSMFFIFKVFKTQYKDLQSSRETLNIDIAREQIRTLDHELSQGIINQNEYDHSHQQIELKLLDDINDADADTHNKSAPAFILPFLLIFIPGLTLPLYLYLGAPDFIDKAATSPQTKNHATNNNKSLDSVDVMMARLAQKLEQDPANTKGWFMLGRSYMSLDRYDEAAQALEKAYQLASDDINILLMYADSLAMLNNGKISGKPFELISKALSISPENTMALWLTGMAYEEQGQYQTAIDHWNKLLLQLKDPSSRSEVQALINKANSQLGNPASTVTTVTTAPDIGQGAIKIKVELDSALLSTVLANDTVFIFARSESSPMPIAAIRKQVKDLPLTITLDDTMSLSPTIKMSAFERVIISAKISKSGNASQKSKDIRSPAIQAVPGQHELVELLLAQ